MAQVIVRKLEDEVVQRLKARAQERGHSLERELREILTEASSRPSREQRLAEIENLRALTPAVPQTDSTELIRAERDRR